MDRRTLVRGFAAAGAATLLAPLTRSLADTLLKEMKALKPGEFTWHPERSPKGPLAIVVSIPDQRVHVYRNGIRIAVSTCSTGKPGHDTPTGVFTILQKDKNHHSSTYNDAPMPNMNRLTWSGVALHAGNLPGYPASHGCIRLPLKFSQLLFSVTEVGTPVVIAGSHADPVEVKHPGLVLSRYAADEFDHVKASLKKSAEHAKREVLPWAPTVDDFSVPCSIIVSGASRTATILVNGDVLAEDTVTITNPEQPLGAHVFVLMGANGQARGLSWRAIAHTADPGAGAEPSEAAVLQRLRASDQMLARIRDRMRPGLTLITTDLPAHPDTRSGKDFVLMTVGTTS